MKNSINILFTSSGRRVSLIKKFKDTFRQEQINGNIITADFKYNAPTAYISDKHYVVPNVSQQNYLTELLNICINEKITLIIPLIDIELTILSEIKPIFEDLGIKILVSGINLNKIASDKKSTYNFFVTHNINTPRVYDNNELSRFEHNFPLLIKPYDGSSSKGVTLINNEKELKFFKDYVQNAMVQDFVSGEEYTVDVMVDFKGNIKTIVPRLRIETRAGEVSKGITKKDKDIIKAVKDIVKVLPDPVGCITLQCFKQKNGEITFIEINPRFGGGIPLSIEAGANFPLWVINLCQGESFTEMDFSWTEDLMMLRYDDAVFMESYRPMIRAIVFDMDDTLYKESDYLKSGFKLLDKWVIENYKISGFYDTANNLFNSGENKLIFNKALEKLHINYDEKTIMDMLNIYRSHEPEIQLLNEADWVINNLINTIKIGLISDGYLISQKKKVEALKLNQKFHSIVLSDEYGRENWKPSSTPYENTCKNLNCGPYECVYIGDNSKKDFITAKKLGWTTVHIKRPNGIYFHEVVESEYKAHFEINNLKELLDIPILKRMFIKDKEN